MINYFEYLTLVEAEYRTVYQKGKWSASISDPTSGFYSGGTLTADNEGEDKGGGGYGPRIRNRNRGRSGCGDHGGHDGRGGHGGGNERGDFVGCGGYDQSCHNCGRYGLLNPGI